MAVTVAVAYSYCSLYLSTDDCNDPGQVAVVLAGVGFFDLPLYSGVTTKEHGHCSSKLPEKSIPLSKNQ